MVNTFGKQVGNSLITFGLSHQIVKHEYIPFAHVYIMLVVKMVQYAVHKFYSGYFLPNVIAEGLPLSVVPYDTLR